jgi:hypothetical protein
MHRFIQLAADHRLTPAQQQALEAHLAGCADCRDYAAELKALETQLASVSVTRLVPPPSRATAGQVAAVQASYRRHTMKRQMLSAAGVLATIALVAVLILIAGRIVPRQVSPAAAPAATAVNETPTETIAAATAAQQNQPLRYFTRIDSGKLKLQPWQLTAIHETVTPESDTSTPDPDWTFKLTISEVEQLAGFDVLEPTGMSRLLNFQGASFDRRRNIVGISYSTGFLLREGRGQFPDDCDLCGVVPTYVTVETVQIGNVTGEYVEGVWTLTNNGPAWEATPFLKTLRWRANGMFFELIHSPTHDPEAVTLADLIAIAESIPSPFVVPPDVTKLSGPGYCGSVGDGAVGTGSFIWPSDNHAISGYDYSLEISHPAIDLAGASGDPVYASDHGVIVYAGWNNYGYGNVVVIEHGNGWQTLYAHLSAVNVVCGQSVYQGDVIGQFGITGNIYGPQLHFEIINADGKVNPYDYLPAP